MQLPVPLSRSELKLLERLARVERRTIPDQAAVLLARAIAEAQPLAGAPRDPVLAEAILERGLAPTTAQEFLPVKDAGQRRELVQDALREGWDAPQARAAVKDRCDSQQRSVPLADEEERCDSQQPDRSQLRRSRAVSHHVRELRRLLEAAPVGQLEPSVADELRGFARELNDRLARPPF